MYFKYSILFLIMEDKMQTDIVCQLLKVQPRRLLCKDNVMETIVKAFFLLNT